MNQQLKDFEETVKETEEDAELEIVHLKQQYEQRLQQEKETGLRLKGENGIMKKKFNTLQSEIEAHKSEINKLVQEEKKLYTTIKSLEKDIASLKKEVRFCYLLASKEIYYNARSKNVMKPSRTRKNVSLISKRRIRNWRNSSSSWITRSRN
jgi:hypothetical protein